MREGERCGYSNSVEMARGLLQCILYSRMLLDSLWEDVHHLIMDQGMRLCMHGFLSCLRIHHQVFCVCVQKFNKRSFHGLLGGRISLSHYRLALLISLLWGRGARVWIDSPGQTSVRTQWATTKELISNQLPTCFCPAPFIWLEWRAGYHSTCPIHTHTLTHTPPAACVYVRVCVCVGEWVGAANACAFLVNLDYCIDVRGNPAMCARKCATQRWQMFKLIQLMPFLSCFPPCLHPKSVKDTRSLASSVSKFSFSCVSLLPSIVAIRV